MNALTLFFIMKLNAISSMLFWSGTFYFAYLFWQYAHTWWNMPIENGSGWKAFWAEKRKRATVAAAIILVAMSMPSTKDAVIMTAVPAIARHSIWDRLLGGSTQQDVMENAQKLFKESSR